MTKAARCGARTRTASPSEVSAGRATVPVNVESGRSDDLGRYAGKLPYVAAA